MIARLRECLCLSRSGRANLDKNRQLLLFWIKTIVVSQNLSIYLHFNIFNIIFSFIFEPDGRVQNSCYIHFHNFFRSRHSNTIQVGLNRERDNAMKENWLYRENISFLWNLTTLQFIFPTWKPLSFTNVANWLDFLLWSDSTTVICTFYTQCLRWLSWMYET